LLEFDGWKKFSRLEKWQKKLLRMANQAKLQSFRTAPTYHFGILIHCNHKHTMELDQLHGNNLWHKSEVTELDSIDECNTFQDVGKGTTPKGYKKIGYHIVYAVKHTSVVSLRGLRLCLFLAELNQLEAWSTDIGNAYLEAYTDKKVYVID